MRGQTHYVGQAYTQTCTELTIPPMLRLSHTLVHGVSTYKTSQNPH